MDQHVSQLKAILSDAAHKVGADAGFIPQARVIGYLTGRMIYACGMEARFKDRTPYFTVAAQAQAASKLRAVAATKTDKARLNVKPKRKPNDGDDFMPA